MSKGVWVVKKELVPKGGKVFKKEYAVKDDSDDTIITKVSKESYAKLIAASPEMFDTLHEALDLLQKTPKELKKKSVNVDKFITKAYAVLFKVED